jgi:hypothetical protein
VHEIVTAVAAAGDVVAHFEVVELIDEETVKLIKVKVEFIDHSQLHLTELHTIIYQKYSYHIQSSSGELIARWDNSPHWPDLSTFPHHIHEDKSVHPSERITITEVLAFVRRRTRGTRL